MDFSPAVANQEKPKDKENLNNSLFKLSKKDIPSPVLFYQWNQKWLRDPQWSHEHLQLIHQKLKQLSNKFTYNESNTRQQNVVEFTRPLNVLKNQIEHPKKFNKRTSIFKTLVGAMLGYDCLTFSQNMLENECTYWKTWWKPK